MRHLFVPACFCLMTMSGATGPDPLLDDPDDGPKWTCASPKREPPRARRIFRRSDAASRPMCHRRRDVCAFGRCRCYADRDEIPDPVAEPVPAYLPPLVPIVKPIIPRSRAEICDSLTDAAQSNNLPVPFFIRLLYQESGFRPGTVSRAGAEGIAQFMPETAADVGLDNPYDPVQAIAASARLLRGLARQFGNLGLAAAAYNAGPRRIQDWLAKKGKLPQETQGYVKTITGRPAENWTLVEAGSPAVKLQRHAPCQEAAGLLAWDGPDRIPLPPTRMRARDTMTATNAKIAHAAKRTATIAPDKAVKAVVAVKAEKPAVQLAAGKPKHRKLQISQR